MSDGLSSRVTSEVSRSYTDYTLDSKHVNFGSGTHVRVALSAGTPGAPVGVWGPNVRRVVAARL